jgi:hypothetical protein
MLLDLIIQWECFIWNRLVWCRWRTRSMDLFTEPSRCLTQNCSKKRGLKGCQSFGLLHVRLLRWKLRVSGEGRRFRNPFRPISYGLVGSHTRPRTGWLTSSFIHLYSEGTWFEYQPCYRLSPLGIFVLHEIPEKVVHSSCECYLLNPSHFISYPNKWRCVSFRTVTGIIPISVLYSIFPSVFSL